VVITKLNFRKPKNILGKWKILLDKNKESINNIFKIYQEKVIFMKIKLDFLNKKYKKKEEKVWQTKLLLKNYKK
jgi:hypothetical protein